MTPDLWFRICMWPAFVLFLLLMAVLVEQECRRHESKPRAYVINNSLLFKGE